MKQASRSLSRSIRTAGLPLLASLALLGCDTPAGDPHAAALAAIAEHDYPAARVLLQQALDARPQDDALRLLYARTLMHMDNPQGAIAQLEQLTKSVDHAEDVTVLLARAHIRAGEAEKALGLLAERGMSSGEAYAAAVGAHLALGDAASALGTLDEGLKAFPQSSDLAVFNAQRAFDERNIPLARTLIGNVLKTDAEHVEALLLAGRVDMHQRDFTAAGKHFEQVLKVQPWNLSAHLALASMARDAGDKAKADEWVDRARKLMPSHPVGTYFAAQMAYDSGDVRLAQSLLNEIRSDAADFPALWLLRGLVSAEQGNPNTAMTEFERYFAQGGDGEVARLALASLYWNEGKKRDGWSIIAPALQSANTGKATLELARALAVSQAPSREAELTRRIAMAEKRAGYDAQLREADQAIRSGDWRKADGIYSGILADVDVNDAVVLNNAANMRLQLGDAVGAVALARRALAAAPGDPFVLDTLGWSIHQSGGSKAEARELVRRAYAMVPGHPEIAEHWAIVSAES